MRMNVLQLLLILTSLQAFSEPFMPTPQRTRTTLRIGTIQKFSRLDPLQPENGGALWALNLISRPLFYPDTNGEMSCPACVDAPTLENGGIIIHPKNPERIRITIQLKPNQRWGDGTSITGQNIVTWWDATQKSNQEAALSSHIRSIEYDKKHPLEIIFHLGHAEYDHQFLPQVRLLPSHKISSFQNIDFMEAPHPGYSHTPWILSYKDQHKVSFHPNPFSQIIPGLDRLDLIFFKTEKKLQKALQNKKIDLTIETLHPIPLTTSETHTLAQSPPDTLDHLIFNTRNPLLRSAEIRKALLHLTPPPPTSTPATTIVHPRFEAEIPAPKTLWDPEQSLQLFKNQGWTRKDNGLYQKHGQAFQLSLVYPHQAKGLRSLLVHIKEIWKQHGVQLNLEGVSRTQWLSSLQKSMFQDLIWASWGIALDTPAATLFHSQSIPSDSNRFTGQNTGGYTSPDFDRALGVLKHTFKSDVRIKKLRQVQDIFLSDPSLIPIQKRSFKAWKAKSLQGYRLSYGGDPVSRFAEHWYWPHFLNSKI